MPSAPAKQHPDSSTQQTGAETAARTPYSIRYGTRARPEAQELSSASVRMLRDGSSRLASPAPVASASAGMPSKIAAAGAVQAIASEAISQTKAAWLRLARMFAGSGGDGIETDAGAVDGSDVTVASFWDASGVILLCRIGRRPSPTLGKVPKQS